MIVKWKNIILWWRIVLKRNASIESWELEVVLKAFESFGLLKNELLLIFVKCFVVFQLFFWAFEHDVVFVDFGDFVNRQMMIGFWKDYFCLDFLLKETLLVLSDTEDVVVELLLIGWSMDFSLVLYSVSHFIFILFHHLKSFMTFFDNLVVKCGIEDLEKYMTIS